MQINPSLLAVDSSQLNWVIGGMNKAELVSAVATTKTGTTTTTTTTTNIYITPDEGGAD